MSKEQKINAHKLTAEESRQLIEENLLSKVVSLDRVSKHLHIDALIVIGSPRLGTATALIQNNGGDKDALLAQYLETLLTQLLGDYPKLVPVAAKAIEAHTGIKTGTADPETKETPHKDEEADH